MLTVAKLTAPRAGIACAACEYGPLTTTRKRMAVACRCAGWALNVWTDQRVQTLLNVGRAYAERNTTLVAVQAALREAERAVAESGRRSSADVWSIFEGRRAATATTENRLTRTVTAAVRWALGEGGAVPPVPTGWEWARTALAASPSAPECVPAWRTTDVLALAQLVQAGETDVLPILADALQDAGCDDEQILGHCRDDRAGGHTAGCWVPDALLDVE